MTTKEKLTYYCPRGCNVFETFEDRPECGACGQIMTTDSDSFEDSHERIELEGIAAAERAATQKVAKLNDQCRTAMGILCRLVQTEGICALPPRDQSAIREKVEMFDTFTEDNDPHHEHDFGAFEHNGNKVFWKIDYYDPSLTWHSEDKADPKKTVRVLTIMLADEY